MMVTHLEETNGLSLMRNGRCRKRSLRSTSVVLMMAVAFQTTADGFGPFHQPRQRFSHAPLRVAQQQSETDTIIQAVTPKTRVSPAKREAAIKEMNRKAVESALEGVDAQMLEMLSDRFLYPATKPDQRNRPKGRPNLVPGAMKKSTMLRFQEREELLEIAQQPKSKLSKAELEVLHEAMKPITVPTLKDVPVADVEKANVAAGVRKQRRSKGASATHDVPMDADTKAKRKRKRVVKNLPDPKRSKPKANVKNAGKSKVNNLEVQKYYRTDLLNAAEEYSLGLQVRFMVDCEEVHEGLSIEFMRLPTIKEWAAACGFVDDDPDFVENEGMIQVRPPGCESMFQEIDPDLFVGNGLAKQAGPGRGRGRQKRPPPNQLADFYDQKQKDAGPLNRGTPTQFVDMLMDARAAKQRMVQSNMRLVVSIARKYCNVGVGLEDLVQEGSLGLSRAAEKFEPERGFKFSTYASWWIQQAVFRAIAYHSRNIRLPVHIHNLLNRLRKVKRTLERDLGRQPTTEEMAGALHMTVSKYNKMLRLTRRSISLEVPKYGGNYKDTGFQGGDVLGDTISGTGNPDDLTPETNVDRGLFREDLQDMLKILNEDETKVIQYRYGLTDGMTRTVTAVASMMKESKAWVRSKECKALRKLRRPWYENTLKQHESALSS